MSSPFGFESNFGAGTQPPEPSGPLRSIPSPLTAPEEQQFSKTSFGVGAAELDGGSGRGAPQHAESQQRAIPAFVERGVSISGTSSSSSAVLNPTAPAGMKVGENKLKMCANDPSQIAVGFCPELELSLCQESFESLRRMPAFASITLVPLHEAGNKQRKDPASGEPYALYDLELQEPIPTVAKLVGRSKQHECCSLEEAATRMKEDLRTRLRVLKDQLSNARVANGHVDKLLFTTKQEAADKRAEVEDCFKEMHTLLEKKRTEILDELHEVTAARIDTLKQLSDRLPTVVRVSSEAIDRVQEAVVLEDNPLELLFRRKELQLWLDSVETRLQLGGSDFYSGDLHHASSSSGLTNRQKSNTRRKSLLVEKDANYEVFLRQAVRLNVDTIDPELDRCWTMLDGLLGHCTPAVGRVEEAGEMGSSFGPSHSHSQSQSLPGKVSAPMSSPQQSGPAQSAVTGGAVLTVGSMPATSSSTYAVNSGLGGSGMAAVVGGSYDPVPASHSSQQHRFDPNFCEATCVQLRNNNREAQRKLVHAASAIAISANLLAPTQSVEITLDELNLFLPNSGWFGVTPVRSLACLSDHAIYLDLGSGEIHREGRLVEKIPEKVSLCEGDVVGVQYSEGGSLQFLVNGRKVGMAVREVNDHLYPFVNVCGKILRVRF
mmetsp:Transcript_10659/g.26097  ORF Transcript_10659/g.26097 Transcript_10659/m.26097 type:complete len:661 (+) Transcript_10659:90-2072(+)